MAILPDDKNWTWVLERACPDCGFEASTFDPRAVGRASVESAGRWRSILTSPHAAHRPSDDRWSALEYACHVRDVFRIYEFRLSLMLDQDGPQFANWDQDETAVSDRYAEQDPAVVADEVEAAAAALAARFDAVPADAWGRTGFRSDGAAFTIDSFGRYMLHDPIHHEWDVARGFEQLRSAGA